MVDEYGHVKMSRKAFESDPFWLESRVFSRWEAWQDLIQMAAWRDYRRYTKGQVVELERGQLLVSERFLAERWQWSRGKVRRFLKLLVEMERIEIADHEQDQKRTIITLINYDRYQSTRTTDGTTDGPPADHKRTTNDTTNGPQSGPRTGHPSEVSGCDIAMDSAAGRSAGGPQTDHRPAQKRTTDVRKTDQREGSKEDDVSQLVSQSNRGGGEARVIPLPVAARSDDRAELIRTAVALANRGMRDNPNLGDRINPIHANGTAQQIVGDWLDEGIPWDVIAEAVYETALSFVPSEGNRQIHSMAYFSAAVRAKAEDRRAEAEAESVPTPRRERRKAKGERNGHHGRGPAAEVRATAPGARPPSKYDAVTIRSGDA